MTVKVRWSLLVFAPLLAGSCAHAPADVGPAHLTLGGQVVARVGSLDLPTDLVAGVASAEHVSPATALSRLVDDALAANGARRRSLDGTPEVAFAQTAALARATLRRLQTEARRSAPSDEEVKRLSEEHWLVVDAPATSTTIHAVVIRPDPPNAAAEASAKTVAAAIAAAVASASTAAEFEASAKAVPHPHELKVVVETLPPLTADGRAALPGTAGQYDPTFAKAAASLAAPGTTSGIVETPFGWHVIRLLERASPRFVPFEERRAMFADEVYARRARAAFEAIETEVRAREGVTLANGVDDVLSLAMAHRGTQPRP